MRLFIYIITVLCLLTPHSKADINQILKNMTSTDKSTALRAYRDIYSQPIVENQRKAVTLALCNGLNSGERLCYSLISRAFEKWHSPAANKALLQVINTNKDKIAVSAAFKGLGYTAGPEEIKFMIKHMLENRLSPARKALEIVGTPAEPAVLAALKGITVKPPTDFFRLLGDIGTAKSIPALQKYDSVFSRKAIREINERGGAAPVKPPVQPANPNSQEERAKRANEHDKRIEELKKNATPPKKVHGPFTTDKPEGYKRNQTTAELTKTLHGTNYASALAAAIRLTNKVHTYDKKYVDQIARGLHRGYKYARYDSDRKSFLFALVKWKNKTSVPTIHDGLKRKATLVQIAAIRAAAGIDDDETMSLVSAHAEKLGNYVSKSLGASGKAGETAALKLLKKGYSLTAAYALQDNATERSIAPINSFLAKNPNAKGKYVLQAALRDIKKRQGK